MEGLEIEIWTRNAFDVEAVRVTEYNMHQVAEWTKGEVARTLSHNSRWYVLVDTAKGSRLSQTKVFVGDYVIFANGQFRHYRNDSIKMVYHRRTDRQKEIRAFFQGLYDSNCYSLPDLDWLTAQVMQYVEETGGE